MENGVVYVEDPGRVSKFGCVPVEMGRKYRGFGIIVNSKDVGFVCLVGERKWGY